MARWGIDFDDVLAGFSQAMLHSLNQEYGLFYRPSDLTHWEWLWDVPSKEMVSFLWGDKVYWNHEWTLNYLLPISNALEGVRRLSASGHELYVVTDRHKNMKPWVEEWLRQWDVSLPVVISNRHEYPKVEVAKDLHIEYFVEDSPYHVTSMKNKKHLKCVYMPDKAYNQNVVAGGNVKRIMSWNEVVA